MELLAAVPSVILGLAGDLYSGPDHAPVCRAVPEEHARLSAPVPGSGLWRRLSHCGPDSGDHDISLHHFHLAGSVAGRSPGTARSGAGVGRHQVGIHLAGGGALRPAGNHRLDLSGSGARLGRDHGGHHGHRQRHRHPHFSAFARLHHRRHHRQRIHRSHRRCLSQRAGRTRSGAVRCSPWSSTPRRNC